MSCDVNIRVATTDPTVTAHVEDDEESMLRVTVELCPSGDVTRARTVATAVIGRLDDGGIDGRARYVAHVGPDDRSYLETAATAQVRHCPSSGPWSLVAAALAAALDGGQPPDAPDAAAVRRAYERATQTEQR